MTLLGLLFLAVPFAFGLLRLRTTGDDYRYLIVAVASSLGALLVVRPRMGATPTVVQALAATAVAAGCAAVASYVVGSRNAISVAVVSVSFALCSATGAFLFARSRVRR